MVENKILINGKEIPIPNINQILNLFTQQQVKPQVKQQNKEPLKTNQPINLDLNQILSMFSQAQPKTPMQKQISHPKVQSPIMRKVMICKDIEARKVIQDLNKKINKLTEQNLKELVYQNNTRIVELENRFNELADQDYSKLRIKELEEEMTEREETAKVAHEYILSLEEQEKLLNDEIIKLKQQLTNKTTKIIRVTKKPLKKDSTSKKTTNKTLKSKKVSKKK